MCLWFVAYVARHSRVSHVRGLFTLCVRNNVKKLIRPVVFGCFPFPADSRSRVNAWPWITHSSHYEGGLLCERRRRRSSIVGNAPILFSDGESLEFEGRLWGAGRGCRGGYLREFSKKGDEMINSLIQVEIPNKTGKTGGLPQGLRFMKVTFAISGFFSQMAW